MSKLLHAPTPEIEAAFVRWLIDRTTRSPVTRISAVWALRADFRRYVRENDLCGRPTDGQFDWLLDDANVPIEALPAPTKSGAVLPYACGIRLKGDM